MATEARIVTLFEDKEKTQAVLPRTKISAVSDNDGVGLDVLLADIDTQIGNISTALANINSVLEGTLGV